MEADKLKKILDKHMKWLRREEGGECANLCYADLRGANLCYADLRGANLCYANLSDALLNPSEVQRRQIVPSHGEFTAFKKLRGGSICELKIPAHALRVGGLTDRKCRVSEALVVSIRSQIGRDLQQGSSNYDREFNYVVGQTVKVEDFCDDPREVCAPGIHCFITRIEAEEY